MQQKSELRKDSATANAKLNHEGLSWEERAHQLERELAQTKLDYAALRNHLILMESSTSWKIVARIRSALAPFPKLRLYTRRAVQLVWWTLSLQLFARMRERRLLAGRDQIASSGFFDGAWYLSQYPDVAAAACDPAMHYLLHGGREGRNPGPNFDAAAYLQSHPDVLAAGENPLLHYLEHGMHAATTGPLGTIASTSRFQSRLRRFFRAMNPANSEDRQKLVIFAANRLPLSAAARHRLMNWALTHYVDRHGQPMSAEIGAAQKEWDTRGTQRLRELLSTGEVLAVPAASHPIVSFILVLHNKAHLSLLSIESILQFAGVPFELIIVDNASTDSTSKMLERIAGATILRNDCNAGFGPACMRAADAARGEYLCFFNNDALLTEEAVSVMLADFQHSDVGAVGGKILLANGRLQEAGSILWRDGSALGYGRGDASDKPEYNFRRPVDYCSGAFLLTPKNLFMEVGGFSAEFSPAYYEDADYCMTLWHNGWKVIYEPRAAIKHYESASSGGNALATPLMAKHQVIFRDKWQEALANHYPPEPRNVLAARISVQSTGLRIVYIDDRIPHRELGAGFPRSNRIVNCLAALGHNVICSTFTFPLTKDGKDDIAQEVELHDGFRFRDKLIRDYFPVADIVWISRPHNLKILRDNYPKILEDRKFRLVYDAEAIASYRNEAKARLFGAGSDNAGQCEPGTLAEELELARTADAVTVVSAAERQAMLAGGVQSAHLLVHSLDVVPTTSEFEARDTLLFVGSIHGLDSPNADSVRYFCREIWPAVQRATGATLVIAGYGTEIMSFETVDPTVAIMGAQQDLAPLYDRARLFVAPTRFAAGVPLKVYEAAAFGVPIVVSDLLARQLDWTRGKELLCANDAGDFAEACIRLYHDKMLWQSIRANALARVAIHLSPENFEASVVAVLDSLHLPALKLQ